MIGGVLLAPALARRIRPAYIVAAGLAVAGGGLLLITQVGSTGGLHLSVTGLILASGGVALPLPLIGNLVIGSAPPERAGSATAIIETSGEFGIAVGVAPLGSLATFVYRSELPDALAAAVPAEAANVAREGITAAVARPSSWPVNSVPTCSTAPARGSLPG